MAGRPGVIGPMGLLAVGALLGAALGCGQSSSGAAEPSGDRAAAWAELGLAGDEDALAQRLAELAAVTVDPPPVVGRDYHPRFPPDLPFDPAAWQTGPPAPSVADPRARRGGTLRLAIQAFPPTVRTEGPNARLGFLSTIHGLVYEPLLGYDFYHDRYVPALATHWQIEQDRQTFRFRLDPRARWADGRPVTADDVLATFEHLRNPDRRDPTTARYYDELIESVRVLDRLTVEVRARERRWRSFLTVAGTPIYPAAYIRMDGETYLKDWNWRLPPGSGPYELRRQDIDKERSLALRRRREWWREGVRPEARGMYNFDVIRWDVIKTRELMYQKFLADELDLYLVYAAQRWVQEIDREPRLRRGWIQKRRIYNQSPNGFGGYAFNMRTAPFDSRNVRLAFAHLFPRETLFEKYFFQQYEYTDSYFPGQKWARPDAARVRFDPEAARRLLAADGWIARDAHGYLVDAAGRRFPKLTLEISDPSAASLRIHELVKSTLWKEAGIELELKQLDYPSLLKKVWDHKFQLVYWHWTAGYFPEPEFLFHSRYAGEKQSNNLTGLALPEADALMDAYRYEFDPEVRLRQLQRLDALVFDTHHYALSWYAPYFRILYWDRFGQPPEYADRFLGDLDNVLAYWWYDEARAAALERARAAGRALHPDHPLGQYDQVEQQWWKEHALPAPRRWPEAAR
ncbi:MAG: ABC transporter substrate-binding protein [Planctomycetota bacterium]|nr:MAG: ABC transporter substrate-binding protein [Planctomycetota bacterium]